ncbi:MAG: hypothetical protein LBU23_12870 [Planctomycetota bacterium]|jgi:hypothetical protein|nr:hypothetical protein [Planctomycetota bacterium]
MEKIGETRENGPAKLDPPAFNPPPEMRSAYLARRRGELDALRLCARRGDWRPVSVTANHVRGTGAMYGFPNIGEAAEKLAKAIQNEESNCLDLAEGYFRAVNESYT